MLHVDVFAFGKIAENESPHANETQRIPTRDCRKSQDKTRRRLKTHCASLSPFFCYYPRAIRRALWHSYSLSRCFSLKTKREEIKELKWTWLPPAPHFFMHNNFRDRSWLPVLVIRRLVAVVVMRRSNEGLRKKCFNLNRLMSDTKITCSMSCTSQTIHNTSLRSKSLFSKPWVWHDRVSTSLKAMYCTKVSMANSSLYKSSSTWYDTTSPQLAPKFGKWTLIRQPKSSVLLAHSAFLFKVWIEIFIGVDGSLGLTDADVSRVIEEGDYRTTWDECVGRAKLSAVWSARWPRSMSSPSLPSSSSSDAIGAKTGGDDEKSERGMESRSCEWDGWRHQSGPSIQQPNYRNPSDQIHLIYSWCVSSEETVLADKIPRCGRKITVK